MVKKLLTTVNVSNCRLATLAGEAMFFDEVVSFASYAGSSGNTPFYLAFKDSAGKYAYAYGFTVGGGESLDTELSDTWSNNALETLTLSGSDIVSAIESTGTGSTCWKQAPALVVGRIVKSYIHTFTKNSGTTPTLYLGSSTNSLGSPTGVVIASPASSLTVYSNFLYTYFGYRNFSGAFSNFAASGHSFKALLDIPSTGLRLVSTFNGSIRNMESVDSGFNPNGIVSVDVYSVSAQPETLTQAVSNCRIATKAGGAMFFDEVTDFSAWAGSAGNTPYYLAWKDSAGKYAYAYGFTVGGGESLGADLSPNNTAISDSQTEANATTGWSPFGTPDTFEATNAGTPNTGSYHFHVISLTAAYKGFTRPTTTEERIEGRLYKQAYAVKVVSGVVYIQTQGTGFNINKTYNTGEYIVSSFYHTGVSFATTLYFRTKNVAGEFYIDNQNGKALSDIPVTGLKLISTFNGDGSIRNMASVDAGFNPNAITTVYVYTVVAPSTPSPANGSTVAYTTSQALQVTNADTGACDIKFYTGAGVQIGATQSGVAAGATATVIWSGLTGGVQSWYATATNIVGTRQSVTWSFTILEDGWQHEVAGLSGEGLHSFAGIEKVNLGEIAGI